MVSKRSTEERDAALLDELVEEHSSFPQLLSSSDVLAAADTECEFLIHNAVPKRAVTFIVGQSHEGKSWVAYDLALAVARGEPWLGMASAVGPSPVLILNFDNPTGELGRRFKRLGMRPDDRIFFHSSDKPLKIPEYSDILFGLVQRLKPAMILTDSFRQSHTLDENSSKDMAQVMSVFKSLTTLGAAVVNIHHTVKSVDDMEALLSARGSGEIIGSMDAGIVVSKGKLQWAKTRCWVGDKSPDVEFSVKDFGESTKVLRKGENRPAASVDDLKDEISHYISAGGSPTPLEGMAKALQRRTADVREAWRQLKKE